MEHPENDSAYKGLKVNSGVETLGPVNPYLSQMRRKRATQLSVNDYVEGPVVDKLNQLGEMWVFGKDVKGREVYIKIMLSIHCTQTICISFHLAEFPLHYPLK